MNNKTMAILGIMAACAAGCSSSTDTETTRDSAVDVPAATGGVSGSGGALGSGGAIGSGGALGSGGAIGSGSTVIGAGGKGVDAGPGAGGAATGGRPGSGGAGIGGKPVDSGLDSGGPMIDGQIDAIKDAPAELPTVKPTDGASDAPACIDQLISKAQSDPVGYPPVSFDQCTYQGQTVYYAPPQCCDQMSQLYAADCTVICAPDGGFTGKGDGRCPDFDQKTCTLLWRDTRTH